MTVNGGIKGAKKQQTREIDQAVQLRKKYFEAKKNNQPIKKIPLPIAMTNQKSPFSRFFAKERPSLDHEVEKKKLLITEELLERMAQKNISRSQLARLLNVKPARITSMLTGSNNFTLETLVKITRAVNAELHLHLVPEGCESLWQVYDGDEVHQAFRVEKKEPRPTYSSFRIQDEASNDDALSA